MGKTIFNSTILEKKRLRDRLARSCSDSFHDDVYNALCVTEDALALHKMHQVIMDIKHELEHSVDENGCRLRNRYQCMQKMLNKIDDFYHSVNRKKRKSRR